MQNTWAAWEQRALRFRVVQAKVRWFQEANILGLILHLPLMGLPDLPLPRLPGTQLFSIHKQIQIPVNTKIYI